MDSALLQNLMAGAGSSSQFIGGLVVALLYVVIGLLSAIVEPPDFGRFRTHPNAREGTFWKHVGP